MIRKAVGNDKLSVKLENLRDKKTASMLTVDEQSRRMADMMKMYAASGMPMGLDSFAKEGQTLILNAKHPLVKYVMEHDEDKNTKMICQQLAGEFPTDRVKKCKTAIRHVSGGSFFAAAYKALREGIMLLR